MPKIDIAAVSARKGSGYPPPFDVPCAARTRRRLGDAGGLRDFGVNLMTLPAGSWSSQRHWHSHEDEFVYVLEGEVVLRSAAGEQRLGAGMCAGFPAGSQDGHQLINRSERPALYLEISNRNAEDAVYYSDPEVDLIWNPPHARGQITHRDGTPY